MDLSKATHYAIINIINEHNLSAIKYAEQHGLPKSTIYSLIRKRSTSPRIDTIKRICDIEGITLVEFFSRKEFENIDE